MKKDDQTYFISMPTFENLEVKEKDFSVIGWGVDGWEDGGKVRATQGHEIAR
jgi:hypothetical protein